MTNEMFTDWPATDILELYFLHYLIISGSVHIFQNINTLDNFLLYGNWKYLGLVNMDRM